jgi:nitroreductase
MELMDAIRGRRSVRLYEPDQVSQEVVAELLEAANMAPTASNRQPWEFIILGREDIQAMLPITDQAFEERFGHLPPDEVVKKLGRLSIPDSDKYRGLHRFYRSLGGAPVVIVAYVERGKDDFERLLNIADVSAAVQNLLLAAFERGLGSCWMLGPVQKKAAALQEFLSIPANKEIIAIIPVGRPKAVPEAPAKDPVAGKVRWGRPQ